MRHRHCCRLKQKPMAQTRHCQCSTDAVPYQLSWVLKMRLFLYVPFALAIAGLCVALAPANAASCSQLVGTADGWDKSDALSGSQAALAQEVNDFKKGK